MVTPSQARSGRGKSWRQHDRDDRPIASAQNFAADHEEAINRSHDRCAALVATDPFPSASAIGLALLGFACGPIFPSLIAATPARLGAAHAANAVGFQIAASAFGQALIPWAVGGLAERDTLAVLGPVLLGFALALFAVHEVLVRSASVASNAAEAV